MVISLSLQNLFFLYGQWQANGARLYGSSNSNKTAEQIVGLDLEETCLTLNLPALTLNPRATVTEKLSWMTGGTMSNTVGGDDTGIQRTKLSVWSLFRHQSNRFQRILMDKALKAIYPYMTCKSWPRTTVKITWSRPKKNLPDTAKSKAHEQSGY